MQQRDTAASWPDSDPSSQLGSDGGVLARTGGTKRVLWLVINPLNYIHLVREGNLCITSVQRTLTGVVTVSGLSGRVGSVLIEINKQTLGNNNLFIKAMRLRLLCDHYLT